MVYGCTSDDEKQNTEESNSNGPNNGSGNEQTITQEDTEAVKNQHANERTVVKNNGEQEINALTQYPNFDLEVQYKNNISFDVEYTNDKNGDTAKIDDELNNVHLTGEDAKNALLKNFELLNFDENSDESEIVIQILTAFNLTDDFTEIELQIKYQSGTVREYKFTN